MSRTEKGSGMENRLEGELVLEVDGEEVPFMRTVGWTRLSREGSSCEVEGIGRDESLESSGTSLLSSGASSRSGAGESSVSGVRMPSTAMSGSCLSGAGGRESVCECGRGAVFCWRGGEPESGAGERDELLSSCISWAGWAGEVVLSRGRWMSCGERGC